MKKGNGSKRLVQLGRLYIWDFPAIWRLLELLEVPHTSKNVSKPSKSLVIISVVLSKSLRVLVLG